MCIRDRLVTGLKGVKIQRQVGDVFTQHGSGTTLVDLLKTRSLIGLGGIISNAPRHSQALSIMLDGIQPEGITDIYIDTGGFLPYAGILSANGETESRISSIEPVSYTHLDVYKRQKPQGSCSSTSQRFWRHYTG